MDEAHTSRPRRTPLWQRLIPWLVTAACFTYLKRAKLPRFRLYDLRHTYASLLLAQNAPITYVSERLGHTDATTTFRWYARWIPRGDKRVVDALDEVRPQRISFPAESWH